MSAKMPANMRAVIEVDDGKCVNCHACIAACPIKFCIDGSGDKVRLRQELCIGCGACIPACSHGARRGIDDFAAFMEAASRREKMIAVVAPAVAATWPADYLRLNGWLKSLGVEAIFDVAFGAELTVESYLDHIRRNSPPLVIAQPCPAIVSFIEIYMPELLPHLAPADSPMLHAIKMAREYHPELKGRKVAVISPCVAKRREFDETGLGDYNVTIESLLAHFKEKGIALGAFPELEFDNPLAERAVLFSSPGGLKETVEREVPDAAPRIRKSEGPRQIYPYLRELPEALRYGAAPLVLDCLNCEKGCNGGTGTGNQAKPIDILEAAVRKRDARQRERLSGGGLKHAPKHAVGKSVKQFWKPGLYGRSYVDRSSSFSLRMPDEAELEAIYRRMRKEKEEDFLNCTSCGYGSCEEMAVAIHNGLNKPEHCRHYKELVLATSKSAVEGMSTELDRELGRSTRLLDEVMALLPELTRLTDEQAASLEESNRRIGGLLSALKSSSAAAIERQSGLSGLLASAASVQSELSGSLEAVHSLKDRMAGVNDMVGGINKLAAQTNLLSMNAAIEAAHAGSSGQGFAVVASEIRSLADQSGKSASSIAKTLGAMAKDMAATTAITEKSGASIRNVLGDLEDSAAGMRGLFDSLAGISADTDGIGAVLVSLTDAATNVRRTYLRMEEALRNTAGEISSIASISRDNLRKIQGL
jgi:iron only hydrogenase large subunit-like protein